jgi:hypothetical protein
VIPNWNFIPSVNYPGHAPTASPSPATGTTTNLDVLGSDLNDNGGDSSLTYTWSTTGTPPAPVVFSVNGTNAAKNSTAIFTKAGTYSFLVTIKDSGGLTCTSSTSVTVNQTLTSIVLSPNPVTVTIGGTQQFTAVAKDQFGNSLTSQPSFTWTATPGTISSAGLYTAPMSGTTATVTASSGGKSGTATVNIYTPASIAGRYIFYNNSKFDAASDNGAIATDKTALLPGLTATFANYTSYSLGINGIIVDIKGLAKAGSLAAADFQFQVGNVAGWTPAPDPISISAPGGGGAGSSDRVTIIWDDNAIQNQWLQVTVLADANTGLAAADVFYFGNAIGESGNSTIDAVVDPQDETASRTHKTGFSAAAIDNHYDYNRDGRVNATDDLIARHNRTDGVDGNPLQLIDPPAGAPLAAGDALQPLFAVADIAITQPATAETAILQPATADVATSPPAASLEDDAILRTAALSVENTTSRPLMPSEDQAASRLEMPLAAEIAPALPAFAPVQTPLVQAPLPACPAVLDFASVPLSSAAAQFPGALHPRDIAGNTILFSTSLNAGASGQWVPTPERWNQISMPERGNQISTVEPENRIDNAPHNPAAPLQDRLHDAVFARSVARFSLTEEDGQPDDSSAPADIETFLNDCLPAKSDKSPAYAIDNVFAALRHKKE